MSIMAYFLKNSTIRLAVYGVGIASAFIVTPHILSSMGTNIYGIWLLIASLSPYFFVCNFATSASISSLYAKDCAQHNKDKAKELLTTALQLSIFSSACTLLIALIYYHIGSDSYTNFVTSSIFALSLLIYSASLAIYNIINISHGYLAGNMKWSTIAFTSMLRVLYSSIATLFFLSSSYSAATNLLNMACINSTSFLLEGFLNLLLARKYMPLPKLNDFLSNPFKSILFKVSKGLSIVALGNILRNNTQIYLVEAFLSSSAVTLYSLSKQIINYMNDLLLSAFGIMSPYFSRLQAQNNIKESHNTLLTSIFLSYGVASIVSLGLIFYGKLFFIRWLGEDFSSVQPILTPMALASLCELGALPVTGYLVGVQKQDILAKLTLLEGLIVTLVSILALMYYGLPGIGWTLFIVSLFSRMIYMPFVTCVISLLSLPKYYTTIFYSLVPTCLAQYIYYLFIKDYVTETYTGIILAGIGQGIIALLVLLTVAKLSKFSKSS